MEIRSLTAEEARQYTAALAEVLLDCVHGGASVGFMASLTRTDAETFFATVAEDVARGRRILLAAFDGAELLGTAQILPAAMPNQPHRADVAKVLVRRSARRRGIARRLMEAVEAESGAAGKTLLVLDTVTGGAAEALYSSLGWTKVGIIPRFALFPDGRFCDTTVFYKQLAVG